LATVGITASRWLLIGLALCALGLWLSVGRSQPASLLLLVGTSVLHGFVPDMVFMAETWVGVLIAISLALYSRQKWAWAATVGVLAVFVRELAVLYALGCGLAALMAGRRREFAVWLIGGLAYAWYYGLHVSAVHAAMLPSDYARTSSWLHGFGLPFLLETMKFYPWLRVLPLLAPIALGLIVIAWAAPKLPQQARVAGMAYLLLFLVAGQSFNAYWGLITAPLWGITLWYAPDGMRTLWQGCRVTERSASGSPQRAPVQSILQP